MRPRCPPLPHWPALARAVAVLVLLAGCGDAAPAYYQGYVEGEFVRIAAPTAGRLEALAVARGDAVAAGAALFRLETTQEHAALLETEARLARSRAQLADLLKGKREPELAVIRAQLAQARARHQLSAKQLARQQSLGTATSQEALDTANAQHRLDLERIDELEAQLEAAELAGRDDALRAARAEVDAADAAVAQARWVLERRAAAAPAAGLVADTLFRVGEQVPAGTPVVSLLPPQNRILRFFVPETVVGRLAPGMAVSARCDGCTGTIAAQITFVAPEAEFTPPVIYSREARAKLVFLVEARPAPEDAVRLQPGQPVDVTLGAER